MQGSHAHILTVGVQVRDPEGVKKTLGNFATQDQLKFFVGEMSELDDVVDVITTSLCAPLAPDCEYQNIFTNIYKNLQIMISFY